MGGTKSKIDNIDLPEHHDHERVDRIRDYIEKIARYIGPSEDKEIELFLQHPDVVDALAGKVCTDPNILHIVLSMLAFDTDSEKKLFEYLVKTCSDKVLEGQRRGHYQGQNPLHMAICHGQESLVICLLDEIADRMKRSLNENLRQILHCAATGDAFRKAVMRSELPLSVAASVGNKNIFDALIRNGAELDKENSNGNNVYHCLIEYAYLYPDKLNSVMDMFRYIHEESKAVTQVCEEYLSQVHEGTATKNVRCKILFMRNKEGDNPLQAAIRYGQPQIFEYLLEKAYLYADYNSGLFDMKVYDVTDLDGSLFLNKSGQNCTLKLGNCLVAGEETHVDCLFTMKTSIAFRFVEMQVMQRLIMAKWKFYRKLVYPLWLMHTLFMAFLTWYATNRAQVQQTSNNITKSYSFPLSQDAVDKDTINGYTFVTSYSFITLVFALVYMLQEVIRLFKGRLHFHRKNFSNSYANDVFRIAILLFAICLVVDFFATWDPSYKDYLLIIALIVGWFLFLFFARAIGLFCNFTSLILTVLPTDVFRFAIIIFIELVAFSTVLFILLQETNDLNEDFRSWWKTLFISFQSIFGYNGIDLLNTQNAIFSCIIYIIFIIVTTVLMVNALIAIISNTCDHLFTAGDISVQLRFNEYSIIRFIESVLPDSFVQKMARDAFKVEKKYRYDVSSETLVKVDRYLVELKSLKHLDAPDQAGTERVDFIHKLNMAFTPHKLAKTKNKANAPSTGKGMMGNLRNVATPPRVPTPIPEEKSALASEIPLQINHIKMGICNDCAQKVKSPLYPGKYFNPRAYLTTE
ncbi:hypothetical protein CHS0354_005199 [Potamilus streckersoni]|uniref:Ion transport domain-containing protein n=1 Tax=Potamilus streckersoni TaxID=2493646 RepID=A0AAE0VE89_9BIVA|nr:hypothetical protein CHS0354_005199 [Potamilus streckersoni]